MANSEYEDILRTVREIRDAVGLLPNQVADRVTDRLKSVMLPAREKESGSAGAMTTADGAGDSLRGELAELVQERDRAQSEMNDLAGRLREGESQLQSIQQHVQAGQEAVEGTAARKESLEGQIAKMGTDAEALNEMLKTLSAQREEMENEIQEARRMLAEAEPIKDRSAEIGTQLAELEARRTEFERYRHAADNAHLLLDRFWPEWLRGGALAEWKERLETGVFEAGSPPSFGLLFAAVHTYNAALHDNDPKTLHDSLRDVGRRLYAWLRDLDKSDAEAAGVAEHWAQAINGDCAGRGEIEVPVPGNAANNQWMIFQPRGGSSPDVASVRSWCVRDAQKRPVHRAEVAV